MNQNEGHGMSELMKGKRGLVMGVANDRSIAWGIARALAEQGAELAFSYQGEAFGKRVEPLAQSVGSDFLLDVDVLDEASLDRAFAAIADRWGTLDFLIHAIAFSDKNELTGRFINTSRENFRNSLTISCYSLIDLARRAQPLMRNGGSIITLTYAGSNRVTPFYNVMGVAKAALESSVRYLANDLGPEGIRVNAISPGPMKTLAGAAIGARARPIDIPKPMPPCGPMPRLRQSAAPPSGCVRIGVPAPPAKSCWSMAAITSSACRSRKTCDGNPAFPGRGWHPPRLYRYG